MFIEGIFFSHSNPLNYSASDFYSGVAGGLCSEVVGVSVNDQGFSDDFIDGETSIIKGAPCVSVVAEKGE